MKRFILLLVVSFCLCLKGQNDTTSKDKYDLNDPRNPDCPCHKHQQLADEEYKRHLGEQNKDLVIDTKYTVPLFQNVSASAEGKVNAESIEVVKTKKSGMHRRKGLFQRSKKQKGPKRRKIKYSNKDPNKCFHW